MVSAAVGSEIHSTQKHSCNGHPAAATRQLISATQLYYEIPLRIDDGFFPSLCLLLGCILILSIFSAGVHVVLQGWHIRLATLM